MKRYRVMRFYADSGLSAVVVSSGLTIEEARTWCRDPESSSSTGTGRYAREHTLAHGDWFDGYEEEA